MICTSCGNILEDDEATYYGDRCEGCVREEWAQLQAWRDGAPDAELDARFAVPAPSVH